jgi:D-glycero-alpha-D-manno-heptose 1-phosphate guanylyltransferase
MIRECIILAGGFGTRLRSVVEDLPKTLAPVNDKPFLDYLITSLDEQGINRIIISVGYLHEKIEDWCKQTYPDKEIVFALEENPLGTGGGIRLALKYAKTDDVLIINGDTFLDFNYDDILKVYSEKNAACVIALKKLEKFDRYGCITTDENFRINGFLEKGYREVGLINAGVYLLRKSVFLSCTPDGNFSFEKDFLEIKFRELPIYGIEFNGYFIDIGIPEDYLRVQDDFRRRFQKYHFDKTWTLFLDRDGVINTELRKDYVKTPDEFKFEKGTLEALKILNPIFGTIVVVTNQRGVGAGIMTEEALHEIHRQMLHAITTAGGRIDKIYFAPDEDRNSSNRKPYPAMGHLAKKDYPQIDFSKSVMVGNSHSDMLFGRALGMTTVYIDEKAQYHGKKTEDMDLIFDSLIDFANSSKKH